MPSIEKENVFEIVLPISGRFCRIRRAKWIDLLCAFGSAGASVPAILLIAARLCTIDGKSFTPTEWGEFDFEDVAPVAKELNRRIESAMASKGAA